MKNQHLLLFLLLLAISCKSSTKTSTKSLTNQQTNKENDIIYTEPDYSQLGYSKFEFNGGGSQVEMNNIEGENLQRAEKRLNIILDSINILYSKDEVFYSEKQKTLFLKNLKHSQKSWLLYFETMVELKFPKDDEFAGSSTGMSIAQYKNELIDKRIVDLNPWLIGTPQGDVGSGTIRTLDYSWSAIYSSKK
jgi:hypothetical protein